MNSLFFANGDHLEVDWSLLRNLTSLKFAAKIMEHMEENPEYTVFAARNYNGKIEVRLKSPYGYKMFTYYKGDMNIVYLTNSEITEMYQNL